MGGLTVYTGWTPRARRTMVAAGRITDRGGRGPVPWWPRAVYHEGGGPVPGWPRAGTMVAQGQDHGGLRPDGLTDEALHGAGAKGACGSKEPLTS